MNETAGAQPMRDPTDSANLSHANHSAEHVPAVIIVGPLWARSGTARVIQNQTRYYIERGFFTVFVGVPFSWQYIHVAQNPQEISEGLDELGAHRVCLAALDQKAYNLAKYTASVRHAFRGTTLDWRVALGQASRLSGADVDFLSQLRPTLLHVNYVYTLGFALKLRRQLIDKILSPPIILETHDVQSQLLHGKGERNPWTRRPDRFERLIKSETKWTRKADVLIHISVDDSRFFQALMPAKPQFLALPTIDESFRSSVRAAYPPLAKFDLLFVGQQHVANLRAVEWFFGEVWPLISDRRYTVKIVGPIGQMVQRELPQLYETFRSCFVGGVSDLAPYYQAARCVIAPMVSGSGTSIKTIEALALGKPFVGTTKAFRGMPVDRLKGAGIQAHDEPLAFASAISDALCNEADAKAISLAVYERVFSLEASTASRDKALLAARQTNR